MERAKRRTYLVDPRFQLRWSVIFSLAGGLTATVLAAWLWVELDAQDRLLDQAINADTQLLSSAEDVVTALSNLPETSRSDRDALQAKLATQTKEYEGSRQMKAAVVERNGTARWILVVFVVAVTGLLFGVGILLTHRVAGPMYVIKRQLEAVQRGEPPQFRPLRARDEFKDVYEIIRQTLNKHV